MENSTQHGPGASKLSQLAIPSLVCCFFGAVTNMAPGNALCPLWAFLHQWSVFFLMTSVLSGNSLPLLDEGFYLPPHFGRCLQIHELGSVWKEKLPRTGLRNLQTRFPCPVCHPIAFGHVISLLEVKLLGFFLMLMRTFQETWGWLQEGTLGCPRVWSTGGNIQHYLFGGI